MSAPLLAVVALGSNLGDSENLLRQAVCELEKLASGGFKASNCHRTEPVDCPPGSPPFLNAVAVFEPLADETPESLLGKLQVLEKQFGRIPKKIHNEARTLDLDLIAFGQETRRTPNLTLPHPRAHERRFVLAPLCELAPDLVLPGRGQPVAALLATLADARPAH